MDIKLAVAENLRNIREERRLSLDSAAQLTGVSKSMLGQIERAEVNPTVSVLWKIADGLRVSFAALIEQPQSGAQVLHSMKIRPLVEDGGRFRNYPVFAFDAGRGFEQYRIEMDPGGGLAGDAHMAGTEEYIIVFAGTIRVTVDGAAFVLSQGDGFRFRADVPHRYDNMGDGPAEMSMVIQYSKR